MYSMVTIVELYCIAYLEVAKTGSLFLNLFNLFIFGCVGSSLPRALHCGYSSLQCAGFLLWWLLLLWSTGSRSAGFSSCGVWAQQFWLTGSRAQAQQLWRMGLVAPRHVRSSQTGAQICVRCIGRQVLNHCATKEAPTGSLKSFHHKKKKIL